MDPLANYLLVALQKGRQGFVSHYRHGFLVRRASAPLASATTDDNDDATVWARTSLHDTARILAGQRDLAPVDPSRWVVVELARKPDSAHADRLSVGRTRACDVALRYASVSKLHAYFWLERGAIAHLSDEQSANGTFVDGRRIAPGQRVPVRPGVRVTFGSLDLEYLTAGEFFTLLDPPT